MPDIRIKDLATTATDLADDDFVEVDGLTNGSRKLPLRARILRGDLARRIIDLPISDGATSGRRMQQQPGAAGNLAGAAQACWLGLVPVPAANPASAALIAFVGSTGNPSNDTTANLNALHVALGGSGSLFLRRTGATAADLRTFSYAGFRAAYSGQLVLLEVRVTSGAVDPVVFANGLNISGNFVSTTAGAPPAGWTDAALSSAFYATATHWPSGLAPFGQWTLGHLADAESLAWAQTGVPPVWWQLGTGNVARFVSDMSSSTGWLLTGTCSIAGGKLTIPNDASIAFFGGASGIGTMTTGERRGFTVTVDSISGGGSVAYWNGSAYVAFANAPGTYTVEFTVLASYTSGPGLRISGGAGGEAVLDNYTGRVFGPFAKSAAQPGSVVMPDSGANGVPTLLAPGLSIAGDLPPVVILPGVSMTADGFVLADQIISPASYELVDAYAVQTGVATSTITVRETSSGGTTIATGALSATSARVKLTVSNGLLAANKKHHLTNSAWGGNTVTPVFVYRRIA